MALQKTSALSRLAASTFRSLSKAEEILFLAVTTQDEADCSPGVEDDDLSPSSSQSWNADQEVRGEFLRWLCLHTLGVAQTSTPIVSVRGARFTNHPVDLSQLLLPILVSLQRCRFDHRVDVSESHLLTLEMDYSWVPSLDAGRTTFDKDLSVEGTQFIGALVLGGASIGGDLNATDAVFGKKEADCGAGSNERCTVIVNGTNLHVAGSVFLSGCKTFGEVVLTGARISGDLDCGGASRDGLGGPSLILEKVEIDGGLFLSNHFRAVDRVLINNAVIKNGIRATDGWFGMSGRPQLGPAQTALLIDNSLVQGESDFAGSFRSEGLSLRNSEFGFVYLLGSVGNSELNLQNTKMRQFNDLESSWPRAGNLHTDGFVYDEIYDVNSKPKILVERRLRWLNLDAKRPSRSYLQLARTLRDQGDEDGATQVLTRMEGRLIEDRVFVDRMTGKALEPFGYGYSPQRSVWLLLGTVGIGWVVYRRNFIAGRMTPTEAEAYREFKVSKCAPPHYTRFSALVYSLENTFPLVNLGQASRWQPDPCEPPSNPCIESTVGATDTPVSRPGRLRQWLSNGARIFSSNGSGAWLKAFLWAQILVGWLLATLFVAGVTGIIRK